MENARTNRHLDCRPGIEPGLVEKRCTRISEHNANNRGNHDKGSHRKEGDESKLLADIDPNIPQKGDGQNNN